MFTWNKLTFGDPLLISTKLYIFHLSLFLELFNTAHYSQPGGPTLWDRRAMAATHYPTAETLTLVFLDLIE